MGLCRSVCGNSCADGAMMSVRVAMHWDAHRTDIRRCYVMEGLGWSNLVKTVQSSDSMDEQVLGLFQADLIVQYHAYIRAQAEVLQERRRQRA
ncbi:hypothetical protein MAR_014118 [Mya arenaria]|uniref:Uncharacterized protein n=1 Tax=Mya arenaria TaxID=6604 RepID=A0ABY7G519_MYAAR|nr:hypothetical protein MAR_014118 [Mya arenaria]